MNAIRCLFLPLALAVAGSCAGPPRPEASAAVTPRAVAPEAIAPGPELRTRMHELWFYLVELELALAPPPQAQDVMFALDRLSRIANSIDTGRVRRGDPQFRHRLDRFAATLGQARTAAARVPPDYRPALGLVDACRGCHIALPRGQDRDTAVP